MNGTGAAAKGRTEMPPAPGTAEAPLRTSVGLRWTLWASLIVLVVALLATLVWLAGRYETSQVQGKLERDTADAVSDVRSELTRNVQSLQALQSGKPTRASWTEQANALLLQHREWVRLEWRDVNLATIAHADSPYRPETFLRLGRANAQSDVALACTNARRVSGPAYSTSYFQPQPDGLGLELMELCLPQTSGGQLTGYEVATYSLSEMLTGFIGAPLTRSQEVSFTEADGTRLAVHGSARRGNRVFTAQQLLDLPGNTIVLRMDSWRGAPDLFPNVLTALVTAMSIALVSVLVLLGKDMRRRLRAELDLADALAFRKAMEDSVITGLRARDLQGRITYVNPAFCEMVGFDPAELIDQLPPPYWPPEHHAEYERRQQIRLARCLEPHQVAIERDADLRQLRSIALGHELAGCIRDHPTPIGREPPLHHWPLADANAAAGFDRINE